MITMRFATSSVVVIVLLAVLILLGAQMVQESVRLDGPRRDHKHRSHMEGASLDSPRDSEGQVAKNYMLLQSENQILKRQLKQQQELSWQLFKQVGALAANRSHHSANLSSSQHDSLYRRPPVVFGHMHIPKTGGTTLNGNLSVLFERVCGHRGYSYDAHQANMRFLENVEVNAPQNDSIAKAFKGFSRVRVPLKVREEIGFEDCDWISNALTRTAENPHSDWRFWGRFESWDLPIELHVPCRDPVDHLLSQCNHRGVKFVCSGDVFKQARQCMYITGFSKKLASAFR